MAKVNAKGLVASIRRVWSKKPIPGPEEVMGLTVDGELPDYGEGRDLFDAMGRKSFDEVTLQDILSLGRTIPLIFAEGAGQEYYRASWMLRALELMTLSDDGSSEDVESLFDSLLHSLANEVDRQDGAVRLTEEEIRIYIDFVEAFSHWYSDKADRMGRRQAAIELLNDLTALSVKGTSAR